MAPLRFSQKHLDGAPFPLKLSAQLWAPQTLLRVTTSLVRSVYSTCCIRPGHTSRCAITQPSAWACVARSPARRRVDSHHFFSTSGRRSICSPGPFRVRTGNLAWDKAKGLVRGQRPRGLLSRLPLAPHELHYEHAAPQNSLPAGQLGGTAPVL